MQTIEHLALCRHRALCLSLALVAFAGLAACSPLGALNVLSTTGGSSVRTEGVAYGALRREQLDVYVPTAAAPPGGWPLVVFFYGGSWNTGERRDYEFVGATLAARGVLTLVADYRLYPEVRYPDFLKDSAAALAYGLAHAAALGANAKRVFVMGHSAGGYNAAMLALDPRWLAGTGHRPGELAGWIGLAGPYDFLPTDLPDVQPVFRHPNYPPGAQPVDHVSASAPPSFLGAPTHDQVVSPTRSTQNLADRLSAAGVPVTLKFYERPSHATLVGAIAWPLRWIAPVLDDVMAFIEATPPRLAGEGHE